MFTSMDKLCVLSIFVSYCYADNFVNTQWHQWKRQYNKHYSTGIEEDNRRTIWERNLRYVDAHNNDVMSTFRLGLNEFSDQTPTRRRFNRKTSQTDETEIEHNLTFLPSSFDWRTKGAISPVDNQGQMGSSLPLVATECMESYNFIKNGRLVRLSEIEVYDCCTNDSGLVTPVFNCIHAIGGLCSETAYPHVGPEGKCKNDSCTPVIQTKGTQIVPRDREDQLQIAVLQSPVMAVIDASHQSFQMYREGVYEEPSCSTKQLDHMVQVVGYGSEGGKDYWIVKNSWGESWGMNGYILMRRNFNNMCGIASDASYPV